MPCQLRMERCLTGAWAEAKLLTGMEPGVPLQGSSPVLVNHPQYPARDHPGLLFALKRPGQSSAFRRVMRPQGVALPILNMAIWLHRDREQIAGSGSASVSRAIPMRAKSC
jgi:hypothetical protein